MIRINKEFLVQRNTSEITKIGEDQTKTPFVTKLPTDITHFSSIRNKDDVYNREISLVNDESLFSKFEKLGNFEKRANPNPDEQTLNFSSEEESPLKIQEQGGTRLNEESKIKREIVFESQENIIEKLNFCVSEYRSEIDQTDHEEGIKRDVEKKIINEIPINNQPPEIKDPILTDDENTNLCTESSIKEKNVNKREDYNNDYQLKDLQISDRFLINEPKFKAVTEEFLDQRRNHLNSQEDVIKKIEKYESAFKESFGKIEEELEKIDNILYALDTECQNKPELRQSTLNRFKFKMKNTLSIMNNLSETHGKIRYLI